MSSGEAESTRTRLLAACVVRENLKFSSYKPSTTCACPVISAPREQRTTALSEHDYTVQKAVKCPVLYTTPVETGYGCQPVYTPTIPYLTEPGTEPPQGPGVAAVYRSFPRISGIEQISKPLVGRSCNDRTARLKAGILSSSNTRYVQSVLPIVPYPPCLPPSPRGSGVPAAPNQPCNLGNRRVDYSNPRAN